MAKHLTEDEVQRILNLLRGWQGKLTWALLVRACETACGIKTTRQALDRRPEVKEEFQIRKRTLKTGLEETNRPNDLNTAHGRIQRLLTRIRELERQNEMYREQFIRWQYNAHNNNISKAKLDAPIPRPDLDSEHNI
ncbi:hypothetical protein J3362_19385 [Marinobacter sp. NFXS11]|uniref:hypothetical protein n=1 Tax=Marinobacter sp. NFXS11 TaxID=2818432 RepID=UPI0032DF7A2B